MNKARIKKLIKFLETLPAEQFDLTIVRRELGCGTVACGIGWCPEVFPKLVFATSKRPARIRFPNGFGLQGALKFFDLEEAVGNSIFTPECWTSGNFSKRRVINRLKRLVQGKQNSEDLQDIRWAAEEGMQYFGTW